MITLHSIRDARPPRIDCQKYHRDIEAQKRETTELLRQEIEMRKEQPWLLSPAVTEQCAKWAREREQEEKGEQ